jgi:hypothetical protein
LWGNRLQLPSVDRDHLAWLNLVALDDVLPTDLRLAAVVALVYRFHRFVGRRPR